MVKWSLQDCNPVNRMEHTDCRSDIHTHTQVSQRWKDILVRLNICKDKLLNKEGKLVHH
jgi:hypothetical protein